MNLKKWGSFVLLFVAIICVFLASGTGRSIADTVIDNALNLAQSAGNLIAVGFFLAAGFFVGSFGRYITSAIDNYIDPSKKFSTGTLIVISLLFGLLAVGVQLWLIEVMQGFALIQNFNVLGYYPNANALAFAAFILALGGFYTAETWKK